MNLVADCSAPGTYVFAHARFAWATATSLHVLHPPLAPLLAIGAAAIAIAFAAGAVPFGYLIGRFAFHRDVRLAGSGNIGAANVARTFGRGAGAAVFALDALKGFAPVAIAGSALFATELRARAACPPVVAVVHAGADLRTWICAAAGLAAVLGHCFSPWLGFRGGKGVATAIGAIAAFSPVAAGIAVATWALGAKATGYSSVGSIAAIGLSPLWLALLTRDVAATTFGALLAGLILRTHRHNLTRLACGAENRLGA